MLGDSGRRQIILTILNWGKSCLTTASFGHVKRSPYNHENKACRKKQEKKEMRENACCIFFKNKTKQIVGDSIVNLDASERASDAMSD